MRTIFRAGGVLLAAAVVAVNGAVAQSPGSGARPVKLIVVGEQSGKQVRRHPAVVEAAQFSSLSFQVGGVLTELNVGEAQKVAAGEIIARLDKRDFVHQLAQAQAQFDAAEDEYERARRLIAQDAVSQSELAQRKSQYNIRLAALRAAQKAADDTVLTAPFDGVIAKVHVENFENVQARAPVVSLFSPGQMLAVISAPSADILHARQATLGRSYVTFDGGAPIAATYREAALDADPATQTYQVKFSFTPPPQLTVLPGMGAVLTVESRRPETAGVAVPLGAVASDGETRYVWVVDTDTMTVSRRTIMIKDGVGEFLLVAEGLDFGETIVGAGASYLDDGMTVRAWSGADDEHR